MIYLDNAATTPLDPVVLNSMIPFLENHFGNPSSIHAHGRETKTAIEKARKSIAGFLNASPSEIFFTSGGTEGDNTAIRNGITALGISHIITSPIEHHAVLHCIEDIERKGLARISFVNLDSQGKIDFGHLENLLSENPGSFVSLMHGNNELGNLNDIERIGDLVSTSKSVFHTDTVQTIGHFSHNTQALKIDFLVGSAHKFHGPKGVGFLYINSKRKIAPLIYGGAQERNIRGGTENVYGIVGMAKALEIAYNNMEEHKTHILGLKTFMIEHLKNEIPGVTFNGDIEPSSSLYTVLNVSLPECEENDMLLFNLDIKKISASGGSACSSGTDLGSHVLRALNVNSKRGNVRFSFSKYNTREEIEITVRELKNFFKI